MSEFVRWLKNEWETLERMTGDKYSARKLSIEAGLSPNTLYQSLKDPAVRPRPETCRKLAAFFGVAPLVVLQLAGHVPSKEAAETLSELEAALQRGDLQTLILSAQDLPADEVQLVQQIVDQLQAKRREHEVARGAAAVLVVEDDLDVRAARARTLRAAGFKVLEMASGQGVVEWVHENGELVDLVLIGGHAFGADVVEVTRTIRRHFPNLPVLLVSGVPGMKEAALEAGATEYLVAPVADDQLLATILRIRTVRRAA